MGGVGIGVMFPDEAPKLTLILGLRCADQRPCMERLRAFEPCLTCDQTRSQKQDICKTIIRTDISMLKVSTRR